MKYNNFLTITSGSKLFGTSTPTSDTDVKMIYLPSHASLILGYPLKVTKLKLDANGNKISDDEKMPDNGTETEYIPLQKFVRDFVQGQTYAVEIAFGYLSQPEVDLHTMTFIQEMVEKFTNADVLAMTRFADKQTFDYVKRGERFNIAKNILAALDKVISTDPLALYRLDSRVRSGEYTGQLVLDMISTLTGLPIGGSINSNKTLRTLELNSRQYLETTSITHIRGLVVKQMQAYGDRTRETATKEVDFKSLSHAVRVYQQAIELLDTSKITFPRPNAPALLAIKKGQVSIKTVREILANLEVEVALKLKTTKLQPHSEELDTACEFWLLEKLSHIYGLK